MDSRDRVIDILQESADDELLSKALCNGIQRQHRTHQQLIIGQLLEAIVNYADAPCDGRNEASVRVCRMLKQVLRDEAYTFTDLDGNEKVQLPYI